MAGREVIEKVAGVEVASALESMGYVCVPREPTKDMLSGAYYDALEEDARGVWKTMIGVSEGVLTVDGIPVPPI